MDITFNHPKPGSYIDFEGKSYEIRAHRLTVEITEQSTLTYSETVIREVCPETAEYVTDGPIEVNLDMFDYKVIY